LQLLRFAAEKYFQLAGHLDALEANLNGNETVVFPDGDRLTGERLKLSPALAASAETVLKRCARLCEDINLRVCGKQIEDMRTSVKHGVLGAAEVCALRDNVTRELSCE